MATNKITEKTVASSVKSGAYVLITQQETVNNEDVEALRRASLEALSAALSLDIATVAETKTYLGIT